MSYISLLVFLGSLGVALCSNCQDLSGLWRNQLGSNMTIIHRTNGKITGEYSTAVESKLNAAVVTSNITGTFTSLDDGSLLSFTVLFNRGKSLTTWVGQCLVCDDEEVLFTSWVLRSYIQKSPDRWMSTRVNQDVFKRVPGEENIPFHLRRLGPLPKDERSQRCEKNIKAASSGKWVAENGDAIGFEDCHESGAFLGDHKNNSVAGRSDGGLTFTALGITSGSERTVKGWAGHIYEGLDERILQTAWLHHSFSSNCRDPFSDVRQGLTNYTFDSTYGETSFFQRIVNLVRSG
ncbi:uncharacterized protein [Parasteatoda tepidariorum]|uniref:uncharacterized protein n=1 Tax=Parasteatoda tepidariorum TaxID=114398 RepID=UPI00077FACCE|nr:uncharacterized protein LOC107450846 [Parasteatoda tepidariorum]